MQKVDPFIFSLLSEFLVNLSAGWFAAAFVVPITTKRPRKVSIRLLTINIILSIVCLLAAYWFGKAGK